ncbi:MAG: CBS domain-containing protein [Pirellulales bacterium]|nr:CBS domain-containing protein [Pirellulales bacterium]
MANCPACGYENIDGVDTCERCESPMEFLSKPQPKSWIERSILKDQIAALCPRKPLIVAPTTPVAEVLQIMVEKKIGCVLIVENDKAAGIFSERDALMRLGANYAALTPRPIREFMTSNPETVTMTDRIAFALHKMDLGGYRHIPVLDNEKVVGVISVRDILRYISEDLLAPGAVNA